MKSVKELFEIAKQIFSGEQPEKMEAKLYKLEDGTEVSIEQAGDAIAIGDKVSVNGAPIIAGEYKLEDGTSISVDATGVITEMEAPEPEEVPAPVTVEPAPTQMSASAPEQLNEIMAQFAVGTPEERIARLELVVKVLMNQCMGWELREADLKKDKEAAIAAYNEGLAGATAQMEKQERTIKALFEVVEKIAETPTDEPKTLTGGRRERFEQIAEKREKKFERIAAAMKQVKSN